MTVYSEEYIRSCFYQYNGVKVTFLRTSPGCQRGSHVLAVLLRSHVLVNVLETVMISIYNTIVIQDGYIYRCVSHSYNTHQISNSVRCV